MSSDDIRIPVLISGEVHHLDLTVLLRGIVPAEIPSTWPDEALVCQAVLARSYVLRAYGWGWRHGDDAAICDNPACCLAYDPAKVSPETDDAIARSRGLVVVYGQALAQVFWSSFCGGWTRSNYEAGWVKHPDFELPYLVGRGCDCARHRAEVEHLLDEDGRFGHGIGWCQYGGRVLAEKGYHWRDILKRYFQGTVVMDWQRPWALREGQAKA